MLRLLGQKHKLHEKHRTHAQPTTSYHMFASMHVYYTGASSGLLHINACLAQGGLSRKNKHTVVQWYNYLIPGQATPSGICMRHLFADQLL